MKSKAKFKSDAFEAIHSAAQGLHRAGTIDKATMRDFDESCLAAPLIAPRRSSESASGLMQSACVRALSEHQRVHGTEVGGRHQAAQRHGAQVAGGGREARAQSAGLRSMPFATNRSR